MTAKVCSASGPLAISRLAPGTVLETARRNALFPTSRTVPSALVTVCTQRTSRLQDPGLPSAAVLASTPARVTANSMASMRGMGSSAVPMALISEVRNVIDGSVTVASRAMSFPSRYTVLPVIAPALSVQAPMATHLLPGRPTAPRRCRRRARWRS